MANLALKSHYVRTLSIKTLHFLNIQSIYFKGKNIFKSEWGHARSSIILKILNVALLLASAPWLASLLPVYSFPWTILYEYWWLHWGCASISYNLYSHPNPPILQNKDLIIHFVILSRKVCIVKAMVFPVVVYDCESWTIKKAECWRTDAFVLRC